VEERARKDDGAPSASSDRKRHGAAHACTRGRRRGGSRFARELLTLGAKWERSRGARLSRKRAVIRFPSSPSETTLRQGSFLFLPPCPRIADSLAILSRFSRDPLATRSSSRIRLCSRGIASGNATRRAGTFGTRALGPIAFVARASARGNLQNAPR